MFVEEQILGSLPNNSQCSAVLTRNARDGRKKRSINWDAR